MNDDTRFLTKNHILNSLPAEDLERLRPLLERVDLPLAKTLYNVNEPITHVYFPEHAMISVVAYTSMGLGTEVAVIGREGASGLAVVLGSKSTPYENMVQLANGGLRMRTEDICDEFKRGGAMHDLILKFMHKLIVQISQTALCNRVHSVEQRLSRWLLMCRDRSETDVMVLTQEFLAIMLGSTRTSVSLTAKELQQNGLIDYKRGKMTILDRPGLEAYTCACYGVIRTEYNLN